MLVAIQFEERNLIQEHGESYRAYRRSTPMLVPRPRRLFTAADIQPQPIGE
jgi:protein-S-isoprenylcysteine O-methyltransferase Ste14